MPQPQLPNVELLRRKLVQSTTDNHKSEMGQFLTPASTAAFMASMFPKHSQEDCRLLDAGAGIGALSCAFLDRWKSGGFCFQNVEATAFEMDPALTGHLQTFLESYDDVIAHVIADDYIARSAEHGTSLPKFTHAILNPPYKKIHSKSAHRLQLRSLGIETVNLYSGFVALALSQLENHGQLVAIIPRSFCNGPYYKPFREFIIKNSAIRQIHLFESRKMAFKDDEVLQENVIIRLERGGQTDNVSISKSSDDTFSDLVSFTVPSREIVHPEDTELFIRIPAGNSAASSPSSSLQGFPLEELGIQVSTGPVVDFRVKDHLRADPESGTVPLIYPSHLRSSRTVWPIPGAKKPNAIMHNEQTEKWLYPKGFYCVVRRFSSKEEKRRVVASVVEPRIFGQTEKIGFENHMNLFHQNKHGLPESLARGLVVYLNTTIVDEHFRTFNGHTQVNATDLKQLRYPSRDHLERLGEWAKHQKTITQEAIDNKVSSLNDQH